MEERIKRLEKIVDPLYDKINDGEELTEYEQALMDALLFINGEGEEPSFD